MGPDGACPNFSLLSVCGVRVKVMKARISRYPIGVVVIVIVVVFCWVQSTSKKRFLELTGIIILLLHMLGVTLLAKCHEDSSVPFGRSVALYITNCLT